MKSAASNASGGKLWESVVEGTQGATTESERACRWNLASFEESLARCEAKAYRLAVQLVGSEPAAREIIQETLSAAWQNMHGLASHSEIETWVYRATVKAAFQRCGCAKYRRSSQDDCCLLFTMTARNFLLHARSDENATCSRAARCSAATYRRLRKVVDALPEGLRAVFILCELEAMSVGELEKILDSPSEELAERLRTARSAVRKAIAGTKRIDCESP